MKLRMILCGIIFVLVFAATATGLFYPTPGEPINYTTVRGEPAVFQGSGLYRYDPAWLATEGKIWDAINLFIGLPLFGLAIFLTGRDSLRGRLLLGGLLFYFFYVFLLEMVGYAFNALFLVYTAIFALSGVALLIHLQGIDVASLPAQISPRFPRRLFIAYCFGMGALLAFLWIGKILPIITSGQFPADMAGLATLPSQGIDLGIIVPLMISTGVLLWRRSPWGYLLTSLSLGYGTLMSISISAWIAIPMLQTGQMPVAGTLIFLIFCLVCIGLAINFYRNVQPKGPRVAPRPARAAR